MNIIYHTLFIISQIFMAQLKFNHVLPNLQFILPNIKSLQSTMRKSNYFGHNQLGIIPICRCRYAQIEWAVSNWTNDWTYRMIVIYEYRIIISILEISWFENNNEWNDVMEKRGSFQLIVKSNIFEGFPSLFWKLMFGLDLSYNCEACRF